MVVGHVVHFAVVTEVRRGRPCVRGPGEVAGYKEIMSSI